MPIDNILNQIDGLGKPEDKTKIEVVETPQTILTKTLGLWTNKVLNHAPPEFWQCYGEQKDDFLREAEKILAPHEKILPKEINLISQINTLDLYLPEKKEYLAGLFYTALLNVSTTNRTIIVPDEIVKRCKEDYIVCWGYKLRNGTMIIDDSGFHQHFIGYAATNGCIINKCNGGINIQGNRIGSYGKGILCINYCKNVSLGYEARDGVFITYNMSILGVDSVGGLFIVFDESSFFAEPKTGNNSIFIVANPNNKNRFKELTKLFISNDKLVQDNTLSTLVEKIKVITKEDTQIDEAKIRETASLIKKHCNDKYGNR